MENFYKAVMAYYRFCKRNMYFYNQPSISSSYETWKYVYLYNCNGYLAKYDKRKRRIVL